MKKLPQTIVILILFLVQFIDVLDFMVVMPLGPDFSLDLFMLETDLGWVASSYTFAAALSGILSSIVIDRFDRKKILILALLGLVFSNVFSANTWNFGSLIASRFLAGAFGGPATSICFAIVADLFEEKKRGAVMGKVMSGFSLAAILGVPIGLELSLHFSWHSSFYMVAALGIIAIALVILYMPNITAHLDEVKINKVTYWSLFNKPIYLMAFLAASLGSIAAFMIIPYISPFIQINMNFPRADISSIYFVGGLGSFVAMHIAGKFIDKTSSTLTTILSNVFIVFSLIIGFVFVTNIIPVIAIFAPFMIGMSIRNVANYTLLSKIPNIHDRAGFMSVVSCIQHLSCSAGAILTSAILVNTDNNILENMDIAAIIASVLFLIIPIILKRIENLNIDKNMDKI